jgi:NADH-quinone oxidoreductase subunit M
MIQKVFFGPSNKITENVTDIRFNEKLVLSVIVLAILVIGVYPGPMLHISQETVNTILTKMINKHP